jgi:hypothetical protein
MTSEKVIWITYNVYIMQTCLYIYISISVREREKEGERYKKQATGESGPGI